MLVEVAPQLGLDKMWDGADLDTVSDSEFRELYDRFPHHLAAVTVEGAEKPASGTRFGSELGKAQLDHGMKMADPVNMLQYQFGAVFEAAVTAHGQQVVDTSYLSQESWE